MNDNDRKAPSPEDPHEAAVREARRDLERLAEQGEVIGTSSMARSARASLERAGTHLGGADAPADGACAEPRARAARLGSDRTVCRSLGHSGGSLPKPQRSRRDQRRSACRT